MYCGVVIPSWTETRGFPAESIPNGGAPSLDYLLENHATEKLGDWDAIICTLSRKSQKKSLLSIRLAMFMSQARAYRRLRQKAFVLRRRPFVRISTRPKRRRASFFDEKS
jgi:hypothetical protein